MALETTKTYAYYDSGLERVYVQGSEVTDRGDWMPIGVYSPGEVVEYAGAFYFCLAGNTGMTPSGELDDYWSPLVEVEEGGIPVASSGSDAYARAVADNALAVANGAYELAVNGTLVAQDAFFTAESAYNLAQSAYFIALEGTIAGDAYALADAAWNLAQIGTNTGTAAFELATSGSGVAWSAYLLAVAGTESGGDPALAEAAYALAQIGTNTGTAAYSLATSGSNVAWSAYTLADAAWNLAQIGTNTGSAAYDLAGTNAAALSAIQTNGRALMVVLCSAFTPSSTGPDPGEVVIPHEYDGVASVDWSITRASLRVADAGGAPSLQIEKSTAAGTFTASSPLVTLTVGSGAYETASAGDFGTITSGDKLRMNVLDLGSAQNWFVSVQLYHPFT